MTTLSHKAEVRILEIESFLSNWFHCRPIILPVSPLSLVFPSVYHFHPLSYALSLHFHPVSSLFQIPIPFHPPPFVLHRSSCTLQSHFTSYVFSFPLPFPSFVPASTFNSHPSQLLFASYFHTSSPYSLPFHLIIHPPSPLNFSSLFSITSSSPPFPHCSHVLTLTPYNLLLVLTLTLHWRPEAHTSIRFTTTKHSTALRGDGVAVCMVMVGVVIVMVVPYV